MSSEPLSDAIGYGLLSARPAAGIAGRLYFATDTTAVYRDNGATWNTLSVGGGVTDAEFVTTAAHASLSAERVIDLGAYQLLTRRAAANAEDDHFNAGSLDSKWLAYSGSDLTADLSTLPGWLRASVAGAKLQAVPGGDWTIETEVIAGDLGAANYQNSGLILTNGTTQGSATDARFGIGENNSLESYRFVFEKFVNGSFSSTYDDWVGGTQPLDKMFLRLIKASTTYTCEISTNGKAWHRWTSTSSLGFTPTHFGIRLDLGSLVNYFLRY